VTTTRKHFAQNLRTLRKRAGLTQEALAKRVGVSRPAITQYELALRPPTIDVLELLARALGTTPAALLAQD
jgi:transcriptional regulator with XRE-family HTH domain